MADTGPWIRELLAAHERALVGYATSLVGDPGRAQDVVQETFLRLCRQKRQDVEPKLPAWLFAVCRNLALDIGRKEARMTPESQFSEAGAAAAEPVAPDAPDASTAAERGEGNSRLLREVDSLPEKQREVVRLRFQHGFAYREIADVTGTSVGNVGFLLHTALKTLRDRLSRAGEVFPSLPTQEAQA